MPRNLMFLEDAARKAIGARLARGHVDVFVTYRNLRTDARTVQVDEALFAAYVDALRKLRGAAGPDLRDDRTLMGIAHMPDVMTVTEAEEDQDAVRALLEGRAGRGAGCAVRHARPGGRGHQGRPVRPGGRHRAHDRRRGGALSPDRGGLYPAAQGRDGGAGGQRRRRPG